MRESHQKVLGQKSIFLYPMCFHQQFFGYKIEQGRGTSVPLPPSRACTGYADTAESGHHCRWGGAATDKGSEHGESADDTRLVCFAHKLIGYTDPRFNIKIIFLDLG